MSLALTDAKLEIARVAGAGGDANKLALAASAIKATAKRWSTKNWDWCRRDNSTTTIITGAALVNTAVTNISSTAGLNVGQGVTGPGLPAGVTIAAIPDQLSLTLTTTGVTNGNITLTFAAYIPVLVGVSSYFLPADFSDFYSCYLITSLRTLEIDRDRLVDREQAIQNINGPITAIGPAPTGSDAGFTAADQRPRCRLMPYLPDTAENLRIKYYRTIDGLADPVDIPTDFEFAFLEDCKVWFLAHLNSNDPRIDLLGAIAKQDLNAVIGKDKEIEDEDVRLKSQMEIFNTNYTERGRALRPY